MIALIGIGKHVLTSILPDKKRAPCGSIRLPAATSKEPPRAAQNGVSEPQDIDVMVVLATEPKLSPRIMASATHMGSVATHGCHITATNF